MAKIHKIYISSTYSDLKDYRESVYRTLRKMRHDVIAMVDYVAKDQRPLDKCLQDVDECDLYVGIFAWRYGYIPDQDNPENKSITELEYRQAQKSGKPCLIFLLKENAAWELNLTDWKTGEGDKGERITELRDELGREKIVNFFDNADELAGRVSTAVHNWEEEQRQEDDSSAASTTPAPSPPVSAFQPREVVHHAFIAYAAADQDFVEPLRRYLDTQRGRSLLLSPRALFAQDPSEFRNLENGVRQCHTAVVVLSDALLQQMASRRDRFTQILDILRDRTGHVIFIGRTQSSLERAKAWGVSEGIDGSGLKPKSKTLPLDVIMPIDLALANGIPEGQRRTVGLPCMIIAMTHAESLELRQHPEIIEHKSGTDALKQFHAFTTALKPYQTDSFVQHYYQKRDEWKPFGSNRSLRRTLDDTVLYLNSNAQARLRGRRIKIQHYPFDALLKMEDDKQKDRGKKDNALRQIYREIAQNGCIVIVDEFSLFHPAVQKAFKNSPFFNNEQVTLVTISPFDPSGLAPNQVLKKALRPQLGDAFDRFTFDFDPKCEFGVGNEHRLKRWLHSNLPGALHALREPRPDRRSLDKFAKEVGHEPYGLYEFGLF